MLLTCSGAAYRFDVYENDVATGVGKFPRPPAAATATAMVAMHDRHSGEGACTCNADELRKSFLRAQKNTRHFGQLQTALAMYLPRFPYHPTIRLSPEQEAVVRSDLLLPTDVLYVPAFAGTGKTTTMLHYALARPHVSFLYVSFNKA